MTPARVLQPLNKTPNYLVHCQNIARIIGNAPNMNEVDLRVRYYMQVVGVNYIEPSLVEFSATQADEPGPDGPDVPVDLSPANVDAVFAGSTCSGPAFAAQPGYDF